MKFRSMLSVGAILLMAAIQVPGARDPESGLMLPVELSDEGYLQVTNSAVSIRVPRSDSVYGIGDSVPLIQKNQRYFIGLAEYEDGYKELMAVRRMLYDGQGTAWVTEQNDLIFGADMQSEAGLFYLRPSETLPIVGETATEFRVLCERMSHTFPLVVPKDLPGIEYLRELPEHIAKRVQHLERMKQRVVMTPPVSGSVLDLATTEVEVDSLHMDPLARMMKETEPEPDTSEKNWYEARAALVEPDVVPEPAPTVAAPKSRRLPGPAHLRKLPRPATLPPVVKEFAAAPEPEPAPHSEKPIEPVDAPPEPVMVEPAPAQPDPPRVEPPPAAEVTVPEPAPEVAPPPPIQRFGPYIPAPAPAEPVVAEVVDVVPAPPSATPVPDEPPETIADTAPATPMDELASAEAPAPNTETPPAAAPMVPEEPEPALSGVAGAALRVLFLLVVLTAVFLGAIFVLAKFINRGPRPTLVKSAEEEAAGLPQEAVEVPEAASAQPEQPPPPAEPGPEEALPQPPNMPAEIQPTSKPGTFTGSLHGFHISELIQFLNSSKETGTLTISENNNPHQSRVMFEGGEIYNAFYEDVTGEAAVAEILRLDDGFFVFSRQVVGGCERAIQQSTMSLLMNVHQTLDEATLDPDSFDADLFMLGTAGPPPAADDPQSVIGS